MSCKNKNPSRMVKNSRFETVIVIYEPSVLVLYVKIVGMMKKKSKKKIFRKDTYVHVKRTIDSIFENSDSFELLKLKINSTTCSLLFV